MKDPPNIDEALDEIVRYQESHQSGQPQRDNSSKAFKAWAARVNDIPSSDGDSDSDEGGEPNRVARTSVKFGRQSQVLLKLAVKAAPKVKGVPKRASSCKHPSRPCSSGEKYHSS